MGIDQYHYDAGQGLSEDILSKFGTLLIDLADNCSINMMASWRAIPGDVRIWRGGIGN